jgi:hypothetical protein
VSRRSSRRNQPDLFVLLVGSPRSRRGQTQLGLRDPLFTLYAIVAMLMILNVVSMSWLLSHATGTLLGVAFLEMISKAFAEAAALDVSATVLEGFVAYFCLEKLVRFHYLSALKYFKA